MPQWFQDAKFGIYAHWGPYSVPAFQNEWYSRNMYVNGSSAYKHNVQTYGAANGYKDFIPKFTAPKFNASEWAAIYRRAGARYAGPVAEHADGFAMFKSAISHFNAFEMGPKRDVTGELEAAIRHNGLRFVTTMHHQWLQAWYPTWNDVTDAGDPQFELTATHGGLYGPKVASSKCFSGTHPPCVPSQRFNDYFNGKVFEVVDQYHPDVLYFDARLNWIDEDHRLAFLAHYFNSAANWTKAGTSSGVVVTYKNKDLEAGAGVLDFERGGADRIIVPHWQTDDAMDRGSWSWVNPPNLKNETELIGELVDIVSKNGNLLLDIPPHADGSIDPEVQRTLFAIGDWLGVNGEAIFATRPWFEVGFGEGPTRINPGSFHEWPTFTSKDFRFTTNQKCVFAAAMAWSDSGFTIKSVNSTAGPGRHVTAVSLVGSSAPVKYTLAADGLHIAPMQKPAGLDHVFVFRLQMNGTKIGFISWDLLDESTPTIQPGASVTLRWRSGGTSDTNVAIDSWFAETWHQVTTSTPNTGVFLWDVPEAMGSGDSGPIILRIRSLDEIDIGHTAMFPLSRNR